MRMNKAAEVNEGMEVSKGNGEIGRLEQIEEMASDKGDVCSH